MAQADANANRPQLLAPILLHFDMLQDNVLLWYIVSCSRPFPFLLRVRRERRERKERVWPTAIELPVLAFTQGRVNVNWFEVSRQPGRFDRRVLIRFIICLAASLL